MICDLVQNENNKQKIAGIEDYHRKKIDEDPSNPSFLESHDQFLIQVRYELFAFCTIMNRVTFFHTSQARLTSKIVGDIELFMFFR